MIVVSGYLEVEPSERAEYLRGCVEVVRAARATNGCVAFHLSADPIETGRINIFEQWVSVDAVEAFRGSGTSEDQEVAILDAKVEQHEIAATIALS